VSPNYAACHVIFRRNNKILFVLRENTGDMDGNYSLPAGRCFFEATVWDGSPVNVETSVHSKIEWLRADALPENIMDYQRHALMRHFAGDNYTEFGWPSESEQTGR
jgi:hypothetical protein